MTGASGRLAARRGACAAALEMEGLGPLAVGRFAGLVPSAPRGWSVVDPGGRAGGLAVTVGGSAPQGVDGALLAPGRGGSAGSGGAASAGGGSP